MGDFWRIQLMVWRRQLFRFVWFGGWWCGGGTITKNCVRRCLVSRGRDWLLGSVWSNDAFHVQRWCCPPRRVALRFAALCSALPAFTNYHHHRLHCTYGWLHSAREHHHQHHYQQRGEEGWMLVPGPTNTRPRSTNGSLPGTYFIHSIFIIIKIML